MKLAQFIRTGQEKLLKDFGQAALLITPDAGVEDRRTLENHARDMLEQVSKDLRRGHSNRELAKKPSGRVGLSASNNVSDKYNSGYPDQAFSMLQRIQELRTLRAKVMQAWSDSKHGLSNDDITELLRFNETIDQLIVSSVASNSHTTQQDAYLFETMMKVSPDPSAIFDPCGKLLFLNAPMAEMANTTTREALGKTLFDLAMSIAMELHEAITTTVNSGQLQRIEFQYPSLSGQVMYFDCQLVPVFDNNGAVKAVVKTSRDITERKQAERKIWRSANFDLLTGIPNRRLFLDRLDQSLLEAQRLDRSFALLFIDLDHFKQANDQLGHGAGDRLLKMVAERISTRVRAMDTFARLGGDEFTLIFKDVNRDDAKSAAEDLLACLELPFTVDSHHVHLSASIGVALFPHDGEDAQQLLHNADQAMYAAKESGGHKVQLCEE
jgi:diguanylate cyclase (GGDEF)-like protein/PAS domain S-box-containing protein